MTGTFHRRRLLGLTASAALSAIFVRSVSAAPATPAATTDVALLLPMFTPLPAGEPRAEGPLAVVATTPIIANIASEIGGPRVTVTSLMPPAADPHEFEPTPAELVAASEANVLLVHGLGLDAWSEQLLQNLGSDVSVVTVTDGIPTRAGAEADHDHEDDNGDDSHADDHDHGDQDPHVWLDPERGVMMAKNIANAFIAADPAGKATYETRYDAYSKELLALDAAIKQAIETIPADQRKLVTNHDALGYYADRYGLTIVGSVIPSLETTAQPSAAELAALLDKIQAEHVRAIFVDSSANPQMAETLAADSNVTVITDLYSDTLSEPGGDAATYYDLLRHDTIRIVGALR